MEAGHTNLIQTGIRNWFLQNTKFLFQECNGALENTVWLLAAEPVVSTQTCQPTMKYEAFCCMPSQPQTVCKGQEWNIPYVFFVSDMAIESKATVVSLLRDWVKLFMCNQADVKMVMGKTSQTFIYLFFLKKETQGRKCTTVCETLSQSKRLWAMLCTLAAVLALSFIFKSGLNQNPEKCLKFLRMIQLCLTRMPCNFLEIQKILKNGF